MLLRCSRRGTCCRRFIHGYRINPDDAEKFKLGAAMGVSMLGIFAVFAAAGIVLFMLRKKKKRSTTFERN